MTTVTSRPAKAVICVEPNVKDGKGGLRDLHTLHWLSKYVVGSGVGAETVADGTFTLGGRQATYRAVSRLPCGRCDATSTFEDWPG